MMGLDQPSVIDDGGHVSRDLKLGGTDPEVLQLVLSYMGRRFFDQEDATRILAIEERVEEARRLLKDEEIVELALPAPESALLERVLLSYLEEFDRPSSGADRVQLAQLHQIRRRLSAGPGMWKRIRKWLGTG